ncbi:MAG: spore germination protein [Bacillota bacterium]
MSFTWKSLKKIILFTEPEKQEHFILKPSANEKNGDAGKESAQDGIEKRIKEKMEEKQKKPAPSDKVAKDLDANLEYMKKVYSIPLNSDIIIREFMILHRNNPVKAFIIFFDGLVNREIINNYILKPLMVNSMYELREKEDNLRDYVSERLLPHCQVSMEESYGKIIEKVNYGGCALFVDGLEGSFVADVKGWEHRPVEKPNNEIVIRGPQEAFNEILRTCTAQVRKKLKDEDLIVEDITVGKISKTPCSMLYIKDIANEKLVDETRRRLESINVDYVLDSGTLEQLIEDNSIFPSPQVISTERPDFVSEMLANGRIAIIVSGSPIVLVVPVTAYDLMHSAEDLYIRYPYVNLLRFIRYAALFLALLMPGIYLAIVNYHQDMIPTDLLLAVEASRERVPFPSLVEILLMELSFELIREAGIRVPGPIGPTLGIIGALILGEAAVAANIVSPILIIIVAVTGIGSFVIPSYSLAYSIRIMRFIFILLGALAGFFGIAIGLFILGVWSVSLKSFGVPFMAPFGPRTSRSYKNIMFRAPEWKLEERPDYLNVKKKDRQPKYSMGWKKGQRKN